MLGRSDDPFVNLKKVSLAAALVVLLGVVSGCAFIRATPPPPAPTTTTSSAPTTTTTVVSSPMAELGLLLFGDAGTGDSTQLQVAQQMQNWAAVHRVDALFQVGDVVYEDGNPSLFAARIDAPYAQLRTTRPLWIALGNHDVMTNNGNDMISYLGMPGRYYEKILRNGSSSLQLLVLDSNDVSDEQASWLESKLTNSTTTWQVVAFHHPPYSCGPHGNTASVVAKWVPILQNNGADLVLSGHDHSYQRFQSESTTYVVSGGGGRSLTSVSACNAGATMNKSAVRHHFVGLEVRGNTLALTAVARTGETLDSFTITR